MSGRSALDGQVAWVTGGGRGLGRAYAEALAHEGARVAVTARTASQVEEAVTGIAAFGCIARPFPADLTDAAAVERVARSVARDLGPIDLLLNAAGVAEPFGPISEVDPSEWWRGVEINIRGPFLSTRYALPGMIARGRGRIVNVSSGVGTRAYPFLSSYCLGKTALIRFTECVAAEIRATGVKVFSVSPGMVRTDMNRAIIGHPRSKEWFPWAHENIAARRDWPPAASARLIMRLANGEADSLSGRHITVADDLDALIARAGEAAEKQALMLRLSTLA